MFSSLIPNYSARRHLSLTLFLSGRKCASITPNEVDEYGNPEIKCSRISRQRSRPVAVLTCAKKKRMENKNLFMSPTKVQKNGKMRKKPLITRVVYIDLHPISI